MHGDLFYNVEQVYYAFNSQHIFNTIVLLAFLQLDQIGSGFRNVGSISYPDVNTGKTIVHAVVVSSFVILPLSFLQSLIGHISHSGCKTLELVCPLLKGIHVSMFLATLFELFKCFVYLKDLTFYIWGFVFFELNDCAFAKNKTCIDTLLLVTSGSYYSNETNAVEYLSAKLYLKELVYVNAWLSDDEIKPSLLQKVRMISILRCFSIIPILYAVLLMFGRIQLRFKMKMYGKIIFYLIFGESLIFFYIIFYKIGATDGIAFMFTDISVLSSYVDICVWMQTVRDSLQLYNLAMVCPIILGGFIHPAGSSDLVSLHSWLAKTFVDLFLNFIASATVGSLANFLNVDISNLTLYSSFPWILVYIPQVLGTIETSTNFILLSYFVFLLIIILFKACLLIQFSIIALQDIHSSLRRFGGLFICVISFLFTTILILMKSEKEYEIFEFINSIIFPTIILSILTIETICVCWIYGIDSLSDDFHFKTGKAMSSFYKFSLFILPAILSASLFYCITESMLLVKDDNKKLLYLLFCTLFFVPQTILVMIIIVHHTFTNIFFDLFDSEMVWGDPDPMERLARSMYPPSKEVRWKRRKEVCSHSCLIYNKLLNTVILKEKIHRRKAIKTERPDPDPYELKEFGISETTGSGTWDWDTTSDEFEGRISEKLKFAHEAKNPSTELQ